MGLITIRNKVDRLCDNCRKIIPAGTPHKALNHGPHRWVRLHMQCMNPRDYYESAEQKPLREPYYAKLPLTWAK